MQIKRFCDTIVLALLHTLPGLESLNTKYIATGTPLDFALDTPPLVTSMRHLTIEASTVDIRSTDRFWRWIHKLVQVCSLESLALQVEVTERMTGEFVWWLTRIHGAVLKRLDVQKFMISALDMKHICSSCPSLEYVSCSIEFTAVRVAV